MKRAFDILVASLLILLLLPVWLIVPPLVWLTSPGPALFRQERVGRGFRRFKIWKFRTMVADAPARGRAITCGDDPRITRVGRWLRKCKFDELPQLFNVLWGDMSLVGPRPEVPRYVEQFHDDYVEVLRVRPGITDLASLRYIDESKILGAAADPEAEYVGRILPAKIALAKTYVHQQSLWLDITVLAKTVLALFGVRVSLPRAARASAEIIPPAPPLERSR